MGTERLGRAPNGAKEAVAEAWARRALNRNGHFVTEFLEAQEWLVIPVESGQHFDECDVECLANAAAAQGESKLRAILLESLKGVGDHLAVDATAEGLLLFSRECAHFNYALLPENYSFAVVCTTREYFLVAGSKEFVETATGKRVVQALSDFEAFACDDSWSASDRSHLAEVLRRCNIS